MTSVIAVFLLFTSPNFAHAVPWGTSGDQSIRLVNWADSGPGLVNPIDTGQPSFDELVKQLEEARAELKTTQDQLSAANQVAERYGTEDELAEFREATGWNFTEGQLRAAYNHETPGGGDTPGRICPFLRTEVCGELGIA